MVNAPALYKKYHLDKSHTSIGLFRQLRDNYSISKVFYPGSHVHITPSLVFRHVVYADAFRGTHKFFELAETKAFVTRNKEYNDKAEFKFYQQDYYAPFEDLEHDFDLLISQYAGFVGQATKVYLKKGGLLVCNNSHGDASMAFLDPDYALVGVYRRKSDEDFTISDKNLENYFIPVSGPHPSAAEVKGSGRGVKYTKSPAGYLFAKTAE